MLFKRKYQNEMRKQTSLTYDNQSFNFEGEIKIENKIIELNVGKILINEDFQAFKISSRQKRGLSRIISENLQKFNHVYNFFNIGINEKTLKNASHTESIVVTKFHIKSIEKVTESQQGIIFLLKNGKKNQTSLQQVLLRYRSYDDEKFTIIAILMADAALEMKNFLNFEIQVEVLKKCETFPFFLEHMKDKMYVCDLPNDRYLISNALLLFLDYDITTFSLTALKYRSILSEIFSSTMYYGYLKKSLENLRLLLLLFQKKITRLEFQDQTCLEFIDTILSKSKILYTCRFKIHFPNQLIECLEIIQIIAQVKGRTSPLLKDQPEIQQEENRVQKMELFTLSKIIYIPENMFEENNHKIAGLKNIRK